MTASVAAPSADATTMEGVRRPWWATLLLGIFAVIVGAVLLWGTGTAKVDVYMLLVTMLGLWWLIRGFMDIVLMFVDHRAWGWKLFMGIIGILAGGYILAYPVASAIALPRIFVLVLGIWALMDGIVLLIMAFRGGGWGPGLLGGLAVILGLVLCGSYGQLLSGLSMIWAGAVVAVIGGIAMIVQGFMSRKA